MSLIHAKKPDLLIAPDKQQLPPTYSTETCVACITSTLDLMLYDPKLLPCERSGNVLVPFNGISIALMCGPGTLSYKCRKTAAEKAGKQKDLEI